MRRKHERLISWLTVALPVLAAVACRGAAQWIDRPAIARFLNFTRTFIYIGMFSAWGVSAVRRVKQTRVRRMLGGIAALMVFWIGVREIKFRFVTDARLLRHLWYAYYIPLLVIPMLALLVSLYLDEDSKGRRGTPLPFLLPLLPTLVLIAAVLTNDLHRFVFRFPGSGVWSEREYSYGVGYWIIVAWDVLCVATALGILLYKSRLPRSRRIIPLPPLPIGAALTYTVLYAARILTAKLLGDVAVVNCLCITAYFEICIRCRLIRSNDPYFKLFAAADLDARITDENYNVCYVSGGATALTEKEIRSAPCILPDGRRLHDMTIRGGHAVWTEDISELLEAQETLKARREELEERGALLQHEYEQRRQHKTVEEQNRLYDLLESKTSRQLDATRTLAARLRETTDGAEKKKLLSRILVLGSFIKRREDLVLSSGDSAELPVGKLTGALGESFQALSSCGVRGGYFAENVGDRLPAETVCLFYDFFEDVAEVVLEDARFLNVSICGTAGALRATVRSDFTGEIPALSEKYPTLSILREEDGTWFILSAEGGGSV